jgi:hypothetical protein
MDSVTLNTRCVALFNHPRVKNQMWNPRMFWDIGKHQVVSLTPEVLHSPKVDLYELEVLLAAAAGEASQCAEALNQREAGRADFIQRAVRGGNRPFLRRAATAA